jgi:hypothetical protein
LLTTVNHIDKASRMQHRNMGVEAMGEMLNPPPNTETLQPRPKAA